MKKLFIVKKYILANSIKDALKKEKSVRVDDVWVDEDWRRDNNNFVTNKKSMGFKKNERN